MKTSGTHRSRYTSHKNAPHVGRSPAFRRPPRERGTPDGSCPAAFTLIELLVVIAIIAILAGMLLPALGRAKVQTQNVKCLSNLRQMAIGLRLYTDDHAEKFPFTPALTPGGWPRTMFIDFYNLTEPHLPTNGNFYLCPMDRGPWNVVQAPNAGLRTNQLPIRSSYLLAPGFYTQVQGGSWIPKQRLVSEVLFPSQKLSLECASIPDRKTLVTGGFTTSTAHAFKGRAGGNYAFVDGHVAFLEWSRRLRDPKVAAAGLGMDWASPDWRDYP